MGQEQLCRNTPQHSRYQSHSQKDPAVTFTCCPLKTHLYEPVGTFVKSSSE